MKRCIINASMDKEIQLSNYLKIKIYDYLDSSYEMDDLVVYVIVYNMGTVLKNIYSYEIELEYDDENYNSYDVPNINHTKFEKAVDSFIKQEGFKIQRPCSQTKGWTNKFTGSFDIED